MSLKDSIKRLTASSLPLECMMHNWYSLRNGRKVHREIEKRKSLSLFDWQSLSAEIAYGPDERVIDNNLYGYAQYLKHYAGIQVDLQAYMEHGLFLGNIIHPDQYAWHFPRIITMSSKREKLLQKTFPHKSVLSIGPYIHYATPILSSQAMHALKKELGKVLLVYPFHSMKNVEAQFEEHAFIEEIKRVGKEFDSILISLYYLDARISARAKAYESEGFHLVTAGHRFDRHFVSRQRSHIELADLTMSNGMGTQTGFCIYLKKPHYIFQQSIKQNVGSFSENRRHLFDAKSSGRALVAEQRAFFSDLFSELRADISPFQQEQTATFWGFESVKSPEQIRDFYGYK